MNKLFGLFLLALAFLAPGAANAVTCFWVGGTATWDTTNTGGGGAGGIKWASASGGGTTCAGGGTGGSPNSGDSATFDASSGGGTVTVNFGGLVSLQVLDIGAFTGTLDFATNNNSITLASSNGFQPTGAGVKTLNMGSGTWTLSSSAALWNCSTCANLTLNAGTSTIAFTGTGSSFSRRFIPGGKTHATVSVSSGIAPFVIGSSGTITTFTVSPGNTVVLPNAVVTVTTLTNVSGSSSAQTLFTSADLTAASMAVTNNWTCDWCGFSQAVFTGAGSKTATNSFDFKGNTGVAITAPSVGGGGGRIIGG